MTLSVLYLMTIGFLVKHAGFIIALDEKGKDEDPQDQPFIPYVALCFIFSVLSFLLSCFFFRDVMLFIMVFIVDDKKKLQKVVQVKKSPPKKPNKMKVKFPLYMKRNGNDLYRGAKKKDLEVYDDQTPSRQNLLNGESNFF